MEMSEKEKADLAQKIKSAEERLKNQFKKDIESLPAEYKSSV